MKKNLITIISLLILGATQYKCSTSGTTAVNVPETPYENLSEYNFFIGELSQLEPNEGVIPYDLNSPLFSDYAHKARFVWMPSGTSAVVTDEDKISFPEGTVLIKNFYYKNDETNLESGRKIIETRILINGKYDWKALAYIWNEEQTDAVYSITGDIQDVTWINQKGKQRQVDYIIPNMNQCKNCHSYDSRQIPIGPKIRNLNKDYNYASGPMNQLEKWVDVGYLDGFSSPKNYSKLVVWDDASRDLHERAMAYLDVNCGHCHNPHGAANTSGLTLTAEAETGLPLGIYKPTVSAGAGTGGHTYSIVPGSPETSIMVYRMNSDNPGVMMPEVGRRLIHAEGVALIAEWITNMEVDESLVPENMGLN